MLLHLALVAAHATEAPDAAPSPRRLTVSVPTPRPTATPAAPEDSALDCDLSYSDYQDLREEIRTLRRSEGSTIGIAAEGEQCQHALEVVVRNGPFLGVHRVDPDSIGYSDQCVAVIRPDASASAGYVLEQAGDCRSDRDGPSRMITLGYWLPLGASLRLNQDVGRGISSVVDLGWQAPELGFDPFELGDRIPRSDNSSKVRGLVGFDLSSDGLIGSYVGFRGGVEWSTPAIAPTHATSGLVAFVLGHKWIGQGAAAQLGGGVLASLPIGNGPQPETLYPMIEMRAGGTNRR